jgi:hypothetical protein
MLFYEINRKKILIKFQFRRNFIHQLRTRRYYINIMINFSIIPNQIQYAYIIYLKNKL